MTHIKEKDRALWAWRQKLHFYAFVASVVGEGDVYIPLEFGRRLSVAEVVRAWERTVESIRKRCAPKELGIFIFVPFCKSKCLFCPYPSFTLTAGEQLDSYTELLLEEINFFKGIFKGVELNTLWFGGGTPSILEEEHLKKIFNSLYRVFAFTKDVQVTFECSCSSTDYKKLRLMHQLGVNRVTLGIQSLNDRVLKENIRLFQDKRSSLNSVEDARKAGIPIVNVDLMCGLPGDSLQSFTRGLKKILALKPDLIHINPFFPSTHTNFYRLGRKYTRKDMERRSQEADIGTEMILHAGYDRVGGAFLGFSCQGDGVANRQEIDRINVNSSYLGLGPMAHAHAFGQLAYTNFHFNSKNWDSITAPRYIGCKLNVKEEMRKYIIGNLRYTIHRDHFKKLFGHDIVGSFPKEMDELKRFSLVHIDNEKVYFKIKTRQEQLILAKHFFNPKYLHGIEKAFGVRYDYSKNYFQEIARLIDISV